MKHVGIIAEYNPFHNGHAYQLKKVKELFPEKNIIVLMSGNYVQRGEPAIFNKYLRTQSVLSEHADIVFELPLPFATASAEHFASASILAFHKLGVIDTLCFGAETDNLTLLKEIAHIFVQEPESYKNILQQNLRNGFSFPKARMMAICSYLNNPEIETVLSQPNNILAIEYLKAIERYHVNITPSIIKRIGNHYHDTDPTNPLCSATAIRHQLQSETPTIQHMIPAASYALLQNSPYAKPLFPNDFYANIQYAIWRELWNLKNYVDLSESLSNQIQAITHFPSTLDEFVQILSNKQYTTTRIRRVLLNVLLNVTKQDMDIFKANEYISYLRLLGFRKSSSPVLKEMKSTCRVPIINKVANAKELLSEKEYMYFLKEIHQNNLYTQTFYNKYNIHIPSEYEHSVIIFN